MFTHIRAMHCHRIAIALHSILNWKEFFYSLVQNIHRVYIRYVLSVFPMPDTMSRRTNHPSVLPTPTRPDPYIATQRTLHLHVLYRVYAYNLAYPYRVNGKDYTQFHTRFYFIHIYPHLILLHYTNRIGSVQKLYM